MTTEFTIAQQIACVKREIRMREKVYPRWVARGTMDQPHADKELACMRAVLGTLESLGPPAESDDRQQGLGL